MTADDEAIADAGRPLNPGRADGQFVKRARFYTRNQRDCGAASAVGAATVAISLLIGGGKVTLNIFYVLLTVQTLLIYVATFFLGRSAGLRPRLTIPHWGGATAMVLASTIIGVMGGYVVSQLKQHHEPNTGSLSWWLLLGLAAGGALLGLIIRRTAESLLDELDDKSWKQRVAPLVNEQEQAIAEIRKLGDLLRDAPAGGAGGEATVMSAGAGTASPAPQE